MMDPHLPCFPKPVINAVSQRLNLPSESWMQDWPIEVADATRIDDFVAAYSECKVPDERSAVAALVIASIEEALVAGDSLTKEIIDQSAEILRNHADLLRYWRNEQAKNPGDAFHVSAWARTL